MCDSSAGITPSKMPTMVAEVTLKTRPIWVVDNPRTSIPYSGIIVPRILLNMKNVRNVAEQRMRIKGLTITPPTCRIDNGTRDSL